MRAVVQRVRSASVTIDGKLISEIGAGLLVYLGVTHTDGQEQMFYMRDKILNLRIFDDENEVPNRSLLDVGGEVLLVSQFTLYGDARKGRRPGYTAAARPEIAKPLYEQLAAALSEQTTVKTGVFQADMKVASVNDGPFTILLDSEKGF